MRPVACAIALGGVLIGKTIEREQTKVTMSIKIVFPPQGIKDSVVLKQQQWEAINF